jgi:N-acetylmuramoyl-L-alanine amidase
VFTLSEHGASSEAARWLADRENAALVGGVQLKGKDKILASVLLDLSQTATLEASNRAAAKILGELKKDFHLHHRDVQKAGFAVLKSPDVPSILVETAFISNPDEERNLRNPKHQDRVARAIFDGVRNYFAGIRPMVPVDLRVADAQESVAESGGKEPVARK